MSWAKLLEALHKAGFNAAGTVDRHGILAGLGLTPEQWEARVASEARAARGRKLARFAVSFGTAGFQPEDLLLLHEFLPYAEGLRCLQAAQAAKVARGGLGSWEYYLAAAGGDEDAAHILADRATARL